jgi:hypothetical protein
MITNLSIILSSQVDALLLTKEKTHMKSLVPKCYTCISIFAYLRKMQSKFIDIVGSLLGNALEKNLILPHIIKMVWAIRLKFCRLMVYLLFYFTRYYSASIMHCMLRSTLHLNLGMQFKTLIKDITMYTLLLQHHGVINSENLDLAFIAFWNQTVHIELHMYMYMTILYFLTQIKLPVENTAVSWTVCTR